MAAVPQRIHGLANAPYMPQVSALNEKLSSIGDIGWGHWGQTTVSDARIGARAACETAEAND